MSHSKLFLALFQFTFSLMESGDFCHVHIGCIKEYRTGDYLLLLGCMHKTSDNLKGIRSCISCISLITVFDFYIQIMTRTASCILLVVLILEILRDLVSCYI